jgi:flagellar basal-body rod modification protein FlgD
MEPITLAPAPAAPSVASEPAATRAALNTDFELFLKMLTTQMQNQDPLNPLDSAEYAQQLAAFSTVEQQTRTNQLLTDLSGQFALLGMSQLAGWVGQEARVEAPVAYDGTPVSLAFDMPARADQAVLVVRDASGQVVTREDVPPGATAYDWFGADIAGDPLPEGRYTLSLEVSENGAVFGEMPVAAYLAIEEARNTPTGATLILRGGIEVPATAVTALRRAPGA